MSLLLNKETKKPETLRSLRKEEEARKQVILQPLTNRKNQLTKVQLVKVVKLPALDRNVPMVLL